MAFITQTRGTAVPSFFANVTSAIANYIEAVMIARSHSEDVAHLRAMSDRQLADIGIARENIAAHVFQGKFLA